MNGTAVGLIFWKELRAQRGLWIGVLALAIGLQMVLLFTLLRSTSHNNLSQLDFAQRLVFVFTCAFAVGSTAVAFAGETEQSTKSLLQRLPMRPGDLLLGKLALALAGSYGLLVALLISGNTILAPPSARGIQSLFELAPGWQELLGPCMFAVVGTLFSLIFQDVLITVLVAGFAAAAILWIPAIGQNSGTQVVVIAAVAFVDYFVAANWLSGEAVLRPRILWPRLIVPRRIRRPTAAPHPSFRSPVAWRRAAASLVWKEWRQAFPFGLKLLAFELLASTVLVLGFRNSPHGWWAIFHVPALLLVAALLPGIAAARIDRRAHALRFLANQGVGADGYWLVKNSVWLLWTIVLDALLLGVDLPLLRRIVPEQAAVDSLWKAMSFLANGTTAAGNAGAGSLWTFFLFAIVLLYSLGFLLGLFLPGAVLAFFVGTVLTIAIGFAWSLAAMLHVPLWFTIFPLPFLFLFTSWVRIGDWLLERPLRSAWRRLAASLFLPLFGIFVATVVYRVFQIPGVEIPFEVRQGERATGPEETPHKQSLFVDAAQALRPNLNVPAYIERNLPPDPAEFDMALRPGIPRLWAELPRHVRAWVDNNAKLTDVALDAAKQPPGSFPLPETDESKLRLDQLNRHDLVRLERLLLLSARKFESKDRLDDAYACYLAVARLGNDAERSGRFNVPQLAASLRISALAAMGLWAAHPKQTTARVKRALQEFREFRDKAPPVSATLLRRWASERRTLREELWHGSSRDVSTRTLSESPLMRWLAPWELLRLQRLEDAIFSATIEETERRERDLRQGGGLPRDPDPERWPLQKNEYIPPIPWRLESTTLGLPLNRISSNELRQETRELVNKVAIERMERIALCIADFARVRKKRPDSLEELVPTYFSWWNIPVDPWNGVRISYAPKGSIVDEVVARTRRQPFLAVGHSDEWSHVLIVPVP